jgi:hypothetical protein
MYVDANGIRMSNRGLGEDPNVVAARAAIAKNPATAVLAQEQASQLRRNQINQVVSDITNAYAKAMNDDVTAQVSSISNQWDFYISKVDGAYTDALIKITSGISDQKQRQLYWDAYGQAKQRDIAKYTEMKAQAVNKIRSELPALYAQERDRVIAQFKASV